MPLVRSASNVMIATGLLAASVVGAPVVGGAGAAQAVQAPGGGCAQVQVIAARGTGEASGVGWGLAPLAAAVTDGTPRTVATYGLPYPATVDYLNSAATGVRLLTDRLVGTHRECPAQRVVLIGYSQGAWVVGDTLAALPAGPRSQVAAVVLYGDPRFRAAEPYNTGSPRAGVNGMYPRAAAELSALADRTRSYCYADDGVCQIGAAGTGHIRYGQSATGDAAAFVLSRLQGAPSQPDPRPDDAPQAPAPGSPGGGSPGAGAPGARPTARPTPLAGPAPGVGPTAAPTTGSIGTGVTTGDAPVAPTAAPAPEPAPPAEPEKPWWRRVISWLF